MRYAFLIGAAVLLTTGCDDKPKAPGETSAKPSATTSAKPPTASSSAPAPEAGAATSVASSGHMAHCPSSVVGATVATKEVPDGVELTITATDAKATADIRARVTAILEAAKNHSGEKHTGMGAGGGTSGRCPIVLKNTTVEAADVTGGSKVTVKSKSAKEVDWVRRETQERLDDLKKPGQEGAGARKMAHCPSSVEGATTVVADTKEGVTVTVTSKDATATSQIRERAKHALEASKHDGGTLDHTGEGMHGGSIGRCPVILADTTLEAKDVDGGSMLTVKAKKPAEVAMIQKEAKDRATKFQIGAAAPTPATSGSATPAPSGSAARPASKP